MSILLSSGNNTVSKCLDKIALGKEATMTAIFKNPLPVKMSNITLNIESDELLHGTKY